MGTVSSRRLQRSQQSLGHDVRYDTPDNVPYLCVSAATQMNE